MSFTVYRSSAGSGKTFTLVVEYLKLVLRNPENYRHILALTFTNKAANEMKERVLSYLDLLSADAGEPGNSRRDQLLGMLADSTGLAPSQIVSKARDIMVRILHNFSDFSITTIDSFNHRIVRTFAYDLFLSSDFDVELDQKILIDQAIDELMEQIGTDKAVTQSLIRYSLIQSELDKNWNIEKNLKTIAGLLFREDSRKQVAALSHIPHEGFHAIRNRMVKAQKEFEREISSRGERAVSLMQQQGLSPDDFFQKKSGPGMYFFHLYHFRTDKLKPNSYVMKAVSEDKLLGNTASADVKAKLAPVREELIRILQEVFQLLEEQYPQFILYELILQHLNQLSLITEIDRILAGVMKSGNRVHISEFNRKIESIVKQDSTPYIYVRLGDKYTSFLLDEFQDTSLLQWQNLLPLIHNSLAENNFNLVVGDGKQAIYRWRSGEVEQFTRLPLIFEKPAEDQYTEFEQSLIRYYTEKQLAFNYRTCETIVSFNNSFFEMAVANLPEPIQTVYQGHYQQVPSNSGEGYIRFDFYKKQSPEGEKFSDFNAKTILNIIENCLKDGFGLNDLVILTRANKPLFDIAALLTRHGYPVQSAESVLLMHDLRVKIVLICLYRLAHPEDSIAKAALDRFIRENDLPENHWEAFLHHHSPDLNVFEVSESIARHFDFLSGNTHGIVRLLDVILEFSNRKENSLYAFLRYWEDQKGSFYISATRQDAIRLMTIHKAKGLEFPVVIFAYADLTIKTSREIWLDLQDPGLPDLPKALVSCSKQLLDTAYANVYEKELERSTLDMLNMVYVCFTRPVHRLYVVTTRPSESRSSENLALPSLLADYTLKNSGDPDSGMFEIGKPGIYKAKAAISVPETAETAVLHSSDWRSRLFIRTSAPDPDDSEAGLSARQSGILIHRILSGLHKKSDLESLLDKLDTNDLSGSVSKESLSVRINQILNHPVAGRYFDDGLRVFNECEILQPDGTVSRPDRAVVLDDQITMIDYKTGKPNPHHGQQLRAYMQTAREMGYRRLNAFLIYIGDEIRVEEVFLPSETTDVFV